MSAEEGDKKRPLEDEEDGDNSKKAKQDPFPGVVMFSGATDWADIGRSKNSSNMARSPNTIWRPVRLAALADVDVVAIASGPTSCHSFAISADGKVYGWGRNEKGQLGLGHAKDRKCPTLVEELEDKKIVAASTGRNHSLLLSDDGEVFACGDNRNGQAVGGQKEPTVTSPKLVKYSGPPAKRVACGAEFSVIVDVNGGLWTWGHPEFGQLGHNTEGSYLEKAGKVNFDYVYTPTKVSLFVEKDPKAKQAVPVTGVSIVEVSCGSNHCVVIDEKNRAFSWGFGGYGRLGHSETGNELIPRMIKFFDGPRRGIVKVTCGGQFSLAAAETKGTTYMWGQYHSTKEANMYPKPIPDLSGWMDVRSIGCSGKGWMVAVDDTVIGAVPSPCYGELAMGENKKSSASPVEIKGLQGMNVMQCAMGVAHSIFLARPRSEKEAKAVQAIEQLDQSDQD